MIFIVGIFYCFIIFQYHIMWENIVIIIVLKTGPDWPVEPVEPKIGVVIGSSRQMEQPCYQTGENRCDSTKR